MGPGWCLIWQVTAVSRTLGFCWAWGCVLQSTWQSWLGALLALPCLFLCSPGFGLAGITPCAAVLWGGRWIQINKKQTTPSYFEETKNARKRGAPWQAGRWGGGGRRSCGGLVQWEEKWGARGAGVKLQHPKEAAWGVEKESWCQCLQCQRGCAVRQGCLAMRRGLCRAAE